jgi:hypothetical protein
LRCEINSQISTDELESPAAEAIDTFSESDEEPESIDAQSEPIKEDNFPLAPDSNPAVYSSFASHPSHPSTPVATATSPIKPSTPFTPSSHRILDSNIGSLLQLRISQLASLKSGDVAEALLVCIIEVKPARTVRCHNGQQVQIASCIVTAPGMMFFEICFWRNKAHTLQHLSVGDFVTMTSESM